MKRHVVRGGAAIVVALSLVLTGPASAQEPGWDAFSRGDIAAAAGRSKEALELQSDDHRARHLSMLTSYLSGDYEAVLAHQALLPPDYPGRDDALARVILNAHLNLHRFQEAAAFAQTMELPDPERAWLEQRAAHPPTVRLETTTTLPLRRPISSAS